jgi:hypothetical protein
VEQLDVVLAAEPIVDTSLASKWDRLREITGQDMVSAAERQRCELAIRRRPIILGLKELSGNLPVDEVDTGLLDLWNEALLKECPEASRWRKRHALAVQRLSVLESLKAAIGADDIYEIVKVASHELLVDFPLETLLQRAIDKAKDDLEAIQNIRQAITSDDHSLFRQHFDRKILARRTTAFDDVQSELERIIRLAIMPNIELGLAQVSFGRILSVKQEGRDRDLDITARWEWPSARYTSRCWLGITEHAPADSMSPDDNSVEFRIPVGRVQYEDAGGKCILHVSSTMENFHVLVWAEVDVGIGVYTSDPIVLGPIAR